MKPSKHVDFLNALARLINSAANLIRALHQSGLLNYESLSSFFDSINF
ncbi:MULTISPECIES: hypothetical protein [Microvirga]|nr:MULTISPECIES: hypothetical protein [unclassified Microvirga]MBQ0820041.1 hypothetical protein [Microvirga sp. HBU67558]